MRGFVVGALLLLFLFLLVVGGAGGRRGRVVAPDVAWFNEGGADVERGGFVEHAFD